MSVTRLLRLIVVVTVASLAAPSLATRTPLPPVEETSVAPAALDPSSWLLSRSLLEEQKPTEAATPTRCQGLRVLETCVRVSAFASSTQPPASQRFRAEMAVGVVSGPSMYQFALNNPVSYSDPLGLSSRTDIEEGELFYTWHLGWLDVSHMDTKALVGAWNRLKDADPGEEILISIALDQGSPGGLSYKKSTVVFKIEAARDLTTRKRQLLAAWMKSSEQFESYQGTFPQGIPAVNTVFGWLRGEEEKVGSSFSTEDLVSNLVAFHATVEDLPWQEMVTLVSGRLSIPDEKKLAYLLWDCSGAKIRMGGGTSWQPQLASRELNVFSSSHSRSDGYGCVNGPSRYQALFQMYEAIYGQPRVPSQFEMQPTWEGVEVLGTLDD